MTSTAYTMTETTAAKFAGPFTITYVRDSGETVTRSATWRGLQTILPVIGRLADREKVHSIAVLDRFGNDQTFSSDILPLMEDVTVIPSAEDVEGGDWTPEEVHDAPHGHPAHDGDPGNCAACHAEFFGV